MRLLSAIVTLRNIFNTCFYCIVTLCHSDVKAHTGSEKRSNRLFWQNVTLLCLFVCLLLLLDLLAVAVVSSISCTYKFNQLIFLCAFLSIVGCVFLARRWILLLFSVRTCRSWRRRRRRFDLYDHHRSGLFLFLFSCQLGYRRRLPHSYCVRSRRRLAVVLLSYCSMG